jgi:hypothetical protein
MNSEMFKKLRCTPLVFIAAIILLLRITSILACTARILQTVNINIEHMSFLNTRMILSQFEIAYLIN